MMSNRVAWIELEGAPVRSLRGVPIPLVQFLDLREDRVALCERFVERQRALGGRFGWWKHLARRLESEDADHEVRVCEARPGLRIVRIALNRAVEVLDAAFEIVRRAFVPEVSGFEVRLLRI